MSDRRYRVIFGSALLVAGTATFAAYHLLGSAFAPHEDHMRVVVVAAKDVAVGTQITPDDVALAAWPERLAPPGSYPAADSVVGRVAQVALSKGEPVSARRLAPQGTPPGLEGTIAPDRRAIVVRVSEETGISGVVRAGSHVDVLNTTPGGTDGSAFARVIMNDVRVLGVGVSRPQPTAEAAGAATIASPTTMSSVVTLEVTPSQAEQLAAAQTQGSIQLVLRGYGSADVATTGVSAASYVAARAAGAAPTEAPAADRSTVAVPHVGFGARPSVQHLAAALGGQMAALGPEISAAAAPAAETAAAPAAPAGAPATDSAVNQGPVVSVYRGGQVVQIRPEPIAGVAAVSRDQGAGAHRP